MITEAATQAAFDARLKTFTVGGDINLWGSPYQPQAGRGYLSSQLSSYTRTPLGIGADSAGQAVGTYLIRVNRPAIEGARIAQETAARLCVLFRRGTALALATGGVITVQQASEQAGISAGDWLTVPVVVQFFGTD